MTQSKSPLGRLVPPDAAPGILLMFAMVAALIAANSPLAGWYDGLLDTIGTVGVGEAEISKPVLLWINDGLMAIFFLLVGLELKREVLFGELSDRRKIALPLFAAIGGIAVPSAIYAVINWDDPVAIEGWAIPAATDIAFALGILALLGSRVPVALKVLLTSIAVIDDLAAIVIIALFYTAKLSLVSLAIAGVALAGLFVLNRLRVLKLAPYVLLGLVLWVAVLKSGVHATLAGVALAALIPAGKDAHDKTGLVYRLEHGLHPWVVFGILPVFAFANAGVPVLGISPSAILNPVPLGIALGLFLGKQLGVFAAAWVAVKVGLASLPAAILWRQVYGLAVLCGIGFTMSLFIGSLAFESTGGENYKFNDRLGILVGSFFSAVLGFFVLRKTCPAGNEFSRHHLDGGLLGPDEEEEEDAGSRSPSC